MNFQNIFIVVLLSLSILSFGGCVRVSITAPSKGSVAPKALPYPEQSLIKEPIRLSRFKSEDTQISRNYVKQILSNASLVANCGKDNNDPRCAQFTDMSDDYGCKIEFELFSGETERQSGSWPPTFDFPSSTVSTTAGNPSNDPLNCLADGVICSQADLEAVWGTVPSNEGFKIVRDINFCENVRDDDDWVACAQFPPVGQAIAITSHPEKGAELEGILWLHEFGHTRKLFHIPNPLSRDPKSVMRAGVHISRTKLNREECYRLRRGIP